MSCARLVRLNRLKSHCVYHRNALQIACTAESACTSESAEIEFVLIIGMHYRLHVQLNRLDKYYNVELNHRIALYIACTAHHMIALQCRAESAEIGTLYNEFAVQIEQHCWKELVGFS